MQNARIHRSPHEDQWTQAAVRLQQHSHKVSPDSYLVSRAARWRLDVPLDGGEKPTRGGLFCRLPWELRTKIYEDVDCDWPTIKAWMGLTLDARLSVPPAIDADFSEFAKRYFHGAGLAPPDLITADWHLSAWARFDEANTIYADLFAGAKLAREKVTFAYSDKAWATFCEYKIAHRAAYFALVENFPGYHHVLTRLDCSDHQFETSAEVRSLGNFVHLTALRAEFSRSPYAIPETNDSLLAAEDLLFAFRHLNWLEDVHLKFWGGFRSLASRGWKRFFAPPAPLDVALLREAIVPAVAAKPFLRQLTVDLTEWKELDTSIKNNSLWGYPDDFLAALSGASRLQGAYFFEQHPFGRRPPSSNSHFVSALHNNARSGPPRGENAYPSTDESLPSPSLMRYGGLIISEEETKGGRHTVVVTPAPPANV